MNKVFLIAAMTLMTAVAFGDCGIKQAVDAYKAYPQQHTNADAVAMLGMILGARPYSTCSDGELSAAQAYLAYTNSAASNSDMPKNLARAVKSALKDADKEADLREKKK